MTVPLVKELAMRYPDVRITMVSRPFVRSIFARMPKNVGFIGVNPRQYPGIAGLYRLYKELKAEEPTVVCDLHDVLRTKFLRTLFRLHGTPAVHIIKDRSARRKFLAGQPKTQQETSFSRYAKALARAGFPIEQKDGTHPLAVKDVKRQGIGIAPFAAHEGKVYPSAKMEQVVKTLAERGEKVYIFGAGAGEKAVAEAWAEKYPGVENMVGRLPDMAAEADFIDTLKVMVTMDSGNMHLAALTGTPVISIWGSTHPLGGFLGWGQDMDNVIQADGMACRPCSIFGNKPCRIGGYPCLNSIAPERITDKIAEVCG